MPGSYVQITVSDTGCGIAPEHIDGICESFFTTKAVGKGTGLGLAMIWGFVKQSGGHVIVTSEPGHGTAVSLLLPPAAHRPSVSEQVAVAALEGGAEQLLLVEDDEWVCQYASAQLRDLGYDVQVARDAWQALAILEKHSAVKLLLTSIVMSGMNGRELVKVARRMNPALKVLLCSGNTESAGTPTDCTPAIPILSKPYSRAELAQAVRQAISSVADSEAA